MQLGEAIAAVINAIIAALTPSSCPTRVTYKELGTKYGWDDKTSPTLPWKSVEQGQSDTVKAEIVPSSKATKAKFASADEATAKVSPATAGSAAETLTVDGVKKGETEITSSCTGRDLGRFKVAVYTKKTKTVAVRLVHETGYTSTDIADAGINERLKKVYSQAVVEFTVTRLPAMTVAFDLNGDGKIDVDTWMSDEMKAVRDACKDDSYDYNLFIVNEPSDGSFGFMDFNQRYGFVHADTTTTPLKTVSHELGHGAFGLRHPPTANPDADNLMTQGEGDNMWRLRKNQWDKINPP